MKLWHVPVAMLIILIVGVTAMTYHRTPAQKQEIIKRALSLTLWGTK
jgi:hypothetical protein